MSALTLLVLVAMIALNAGFLATTRRHSNALQLQMSNKPDKQQQKPLKWKTVLGSAMMALSLLDTPAFALNKPLPVVTVKQLEESIDKLEASGSRAETVQTMADLFDAAGSKTLLSRTKYKYRIIDAINDKRSTLNNEWDDALRYESGELKRRVDPFRTVDLGPYLKIAPFVGGVCYLATLFVQQNIPELFILAYPLAVLIFAAPIAFTVIFS
mmetsp:Transcript_21101/g.46880  ORF Transcript_21101/g.46880 Transcript_21101/m.46880 type:complete len:213 (-) Transcript_21101:105-743(-)|eukprot:CAMPEP_0173171338 /NCGR_PEP_ID=MMETSP1141-20130122/1710_1 /TAXON_ID=483371 /ORGANISM="non described non described, Strain CCMP2298" /LENGTH=212 /DNA_ID=CAMNT_0014093277 /DNA_START=173 /DNA_END=811 /DNA_ORIENTATION=+